MDTRNQNSLHACPQSHVLKATGDSDSKRWDDGVREMQTHLQQAESLMPDESRRRSILNFCERCWNRTCFRGNAHVVKDMAFMHRLSIFHARTATRTKLSLRKELAEPEWERFIDSKLKWGVAPGPDRYTTDMIKTMTEPEREILRLWANEVLTTGKSALEVTTKTKNGTITLLHKGGGVPRTCPVTGDQ